MNIKISSLIVILIVIAIVLSLYFVYYNPSNSNDDEHENDSDGDGHPDENDAFPDDPDEWVDLDNDGVGNNTDLYDEGNAGLYIYVHQYGAEAQIDEASMFPDPFFIIRVDINGGDWDYEETSEVYTDINSYSNPHSLTIDVPENQSEARFIIEVWDDDDLTANEPIDYRGIDEDYWTTHTVPSSELPLHIEDDGNNDNIDNEVNCQLTYGIMVTEI